MSSVEKYYNLFVKALHFERITSTAHLAKKRKPREKGEIFDDINKQYCYLPSFRLPWLCERNAAIRVHSMLGWSFSSFFPSFNKKEPLGPGPAPTEDKSKSLHWGSIGAGQGL